MDQLPFSFPFSAVVGMDDLRLALTLNAVSPEIGGVLARGEKGTAKSTTVRALAAVLPAIEVVDGCRFACAPAAPALLCLDGPHPVGAAAHRRPAVLRELPVGATEDRLVGSLDLERALTEGVKSYEPGLLAAAHRGVLYVDEVNLLHDHLVDLLLDAAALGTSYVEREGVSVQHPARFLLVGTMNPEEGELRPQLLDRFGLTVEVAAPREPGLRAEVVRRRLAYDADPGVFVERFAADETELAHRIIRARELLPVVVLSDEALDQIATVCAAFDVDGLRADIVTARTAMAHAAWEGRTEVTVDDIRVAARLSLPHRRRRNPFDAPGLDEQQLDQALTPPDDPEEPPPSGGGGPRPSGDQTQVAAPSDPYRTRRLEVPGVGTGAAGRRSRAITDTGLTTRAMTPTGPVRHLHLVATMTAAAPHQHSRGRTDRLLVRREDLRAAQREGREGNLVLFVVDASGSMAAQQRMGAVKGAVLSLLLDAYQRRDKVGLISFRGTDATLLLPPTSSVEAAAARLTELPTGGRTPLTAGLVMAHETLQREHLRDPHRRSLLVIVTDGRHTAGDSPGAAAGLLRGVAAVVVDCEAGKIRLGLAGALASLLDAELIGLDQLSEGVGRTLHEWRVS